MILGNPKERRQKAKRKRKIKQTKRMRKVERKDKKDEIEARNDSSATITCSIELESTEVSLFK